MLTLNKNSLNDKRWNDIGVRLPEFDIDAIEKATRSSPKWIHIAPSNIYRSMIAPIQQSLIESGYADYGMIAIETHDIEIINDIYQPHDNLCIRVVMFPDGRNDMMVIASISDTIFSDNAISQDGWDRSLSYFASESLQMVSVTCTEKGYDVADSEPDLANGPKSPKHIMAIIASYVYHRYLNHKKPIAFISMDNCAENGLRFFKAVMHFAIGWYDNGFVDKEFIKFLENEITFPWTMIDRITPRPAIKVKQMLESLGVEGMDIITTKKGTVIAPYVNTEHVSYLVIEDKFPNGRPPLEKAGVIFCESPSDVALYEKMKVGACLNPNQTTLAIFGCLLNYQHIYDAIADPLLKELVYRQSYNESLPVVRHPGKIEPKEFLREVLEERLTNPNIPDTPARIITDTSQKVAVRYGDTISVYGDNAKNLEYIPLSIAGWCRYLIGVDDFGNEMNYNPSAQPPWNRWSRDPKLKELVEHISKIEFGKPDSVGDNLRPILSDKSLFGINLYEYGIGEKIENYLRDMLKGVSSVRQVLKRAGNKG